jgi:hypothetical protein
VAFLAFTSIPSSRTFLLTRTHTPLFSYYDTHYSQGGGWCYSMEDCFSRTQPSYAGGALGSSKNWSDWSWKFDLGVSFDEWGVLFFP